MHKILRPHLPLDMIVGVNDRQVVRWSLWRRGRGGACHEEQAKKPNSSQKTSQQTATPMLRIQKPPPPETPGRTLSIITLR